MMQQAISWWNMNTTHAEVEQAALEATEAEKRSNEMLEVRGHVPLVEEASTQRRYPY